MAKKRNGRQDAIRDIVRNRDVRTQRMLVDELKAEGFDCTQATVSRDIAEMGLRKLPEGVYVLAEDLHLQRMVSELVVDVHRADNMLIVKAQPGTANGIAAAIDAAELPDVLGSLAGNDTIFVVSQTGEDSQRLEALLQKLRCAKSQGIPARYRDVTEYEWGAQALMPAPPIRLNRCEVLLQRAHEIDASSDKKSPSDKAGG